VRSIPRGRAGFTIIEVLIALAILVFGMTAILGMLTFGAGLTRTALLRTSAAAASQAVVADLEETLFPPNPPGGADAEGEAGAPVEVKDRVLPSMPDVVYSARAEENPARPLEYRVDVEMSWRSAGIRRATSFSTILVREIPFGERFRRHLLSKDATESPR
jgi:prepilin-type N-terminal cleavage/methylation domain-containing protein